MGRRNHLKEAHLQLYLSQKKQKFPSSILCVDSWNEFQVIDPEIEINNNNDMNADIENANADTKRENDNEINPETTSSKLVLLPINVPIDWPKISETTSQRPCQLEEKRQ
uniref:Uncharacterized protein n=1 Tax=Glossina pallidipes TaxID=7398 RepID=A0A1A9Z500_GLOPL